MSQQSLGGGNPQGQVFVLFFKPPSTQHSPSGPPAFLTLALLINPTPRCSRQHAHCSPKDPTPQKCNPYEKKPDVGIRGKKQHNVKISYK